MVSRKYARLCILVMGIACIFIGLLSSYSRYFLIAGGLLAIAALLMKTFMLRCPKCGVGGLPPQWSKSGTYHCPKCGNLIEYDDKK